MIHWLLIGAALGANDIPPEVWVDRGDEPPLCVSSMPDAKRLKKKDGERWRAAVAAREPAEGEHPAFQVLRATVEVLSGGDGEALLALAERWPDDPCLAASAATVAWFEHQDAERAQRLATEAWIRRPGPQVAFVLGTLLARQGETDRMVRIVDRGLIGDPDHAGLLRLRAVDPVRIEEAFAEGDMDEYLALAAAQGAPLPPGVEDMAGLREALGLRSPDDQLFAVLHTSAGEITCALTVEATPVTVASFVGLATGTQAWTDPRTGEPGEGPMYQDVPFHRVIPGFMIQTGDPTGTGRGSPGYTFRDEIASGLDFDAPGRLAMANSGPGTNGSQFFVTDGPAPHLRGRHTIFGQCGDLGVVSEIAGVETDGQDRPRRPVLLKRVEIDVR